ncbi:hypothetical protein AADZ90_007210 [Aestuariibius sp. 2305UL40-4]|uniref:hypothetical protein n=1 Tax=Aestuariibius violaceus TaxID=3234132 RepID=UPI00345E5CA4
MTAVSSSGNGANSANDVDQSAVDQSFNSMMDNYSWSTAEQLNFNAHYTVAKLANDLAKKTGVN